MYLFFDTETTGLPIKGHDTRVVQLAAILSNEYGKELAQMNVYIKPDGFVIPDETSKFHGITTEKATEEGVPLVEAVNTFHALLSQAENVVAHNMSFDYPRYRREAEHQLGMVDAIENKRRFCTVELLKPVIKIPPTAKMVAAGFNSFKSPNLQEAHEFYFGEGFDGAHDALADVRACKRVFFKYMESLEG